MPKKNEPGIARMVKTLRSVAGEYRRDSGVRALLLEAAALIERGQKLRLLSNIAPDNAIAKLETIVRIP